MTPNWTLHEKGADLSTKALKELKNVWWAQNDNRKHLASQKRLQAIYEANQDIRCGCTANGARMFVRYLPTGRYTVVNHPVQGRHNKKCSFYTDINGEIADHDFGGESDFNEILTFDYHKEINESETEGQEPPRDGNTDGSKTKTKSKLLRLMNQLCTTSFMNTYVKPFQNRNSSDKSNDSRIFAKFRDAAKNIKFGASTLNHFIFYGRSGEQFAERALMSKGWKGTGRRQAFIVEMVDEIEKNESELLFDSEPVFYERVIRPGRNTTSGPYLVLSTLVEDEGEMFRHTACIKPIVSREIPMLVDSNLEREMALSIIHNIDHRSKRTKESYWSLQKPLIPKPGDNGEAILPDFILTHKVNNKFAYREIVEVMGTDSVDYVERKARLIPQMKEKFLSKELAEVKAYEEGEIEKYAQKIRQIMNQS